MAEIRMSTAGIRLLYAVETEKGKMPQTGWTEVPEITEMPETSATPETIDATPLSATKYRVYVNGLMDLGGALSYTANFSQAELTLWNKTIVPAYEDAIKEDKNMWFLIDIPGFDDAFAYTGVPEKIGAPGASVGDVLRITLPITPSNEPDWYTKPSGIATASLNSRDAVIVSSSAKSKVNNDT